MLGKSIKDNLQGEGRLSYNKRSIGKQSTPKSSWCHQLSNPGQIDQTPPVAAGNWTVAWSVIVQNSNHCTSVIYDNFDVYIRQWGHLGGHISGQVQCWHIFWPYLYVSSSSESCLIAQSCNVPYPCVWMHAHVLFWPIYPLYKGNNRASSPWNPYVRDVDSRFLCKCYTIRLHMGTFFIILSKLLYPIKLFVILSLQIRSCF